MYKIRLKDFSIEKIADSGQCFRLVAERDGFILIAYGKILRISHEREDYIFSCDEDEFKSCWKQYFDLDADYEKYKGIALPQDEFLKGAISFGDGIRILRQDPWESLISFIISQRKSVPAIRTSVERLCRIFGENIGEGYFAFPTPGAIIGPNTDHSVSLERLRACGLGYRAPFVLEAAELVAGGRLNLEEIRTLATGELIDILMKLRGVGIKVASCVALFGFHRLDALPVDVWMGRVIKKEYGGHFPEEYLPVAGVLQQYMFYYARLKRLSTL